jgi:hemerythrin-like metal-binding protein
MTEWKEEYATGDDTVDRQHRMIFKMAADFRLALEDGAGGGVYGGLLDSLGLYCRGHFALEEMTMEKYDCPAVEENKAAHALFLETYEGFLERFERYGYRDEDARALMDLLESWLVDHILAIDLQLRDSIRKGSSV